MRMRASHKFRHTIAVISLLAGFVSGCAWIINRPEVLSHALKLANARSDWRIEVGSFRWSPLSSSFKIEGVSIDHKLTEKSIHIGEIGASYRLLGLLRGRFVIDELAMKGVDVNLPPSGEKKEKRERRRIDAARFLIFKRIELVEGRFEGLSLGFGENSRLEADEMRISLIPSIFGDSRLAIRTDGVKLGKGEREILTSAFISIKTSTRIERWRNNFPYIDAFSGDLKAQDINVEGASLERIAATIEFDGGKLDLKDLDIAVDGRRLIGTAFINTYDQSFELAIDIPAAVDLPHIGKDLMTIDTGGRLSGKIRLKGRGLVPSRTSGSGQIDLMHVFSKSPEAPIRVMAGVSWSGGVFELSDAVIMAGDDLAIVNGTINLPGKRMELEATGERFPVEHLFDKFENPHLAKIFGRSDFEASITGWGRNFKAHVEGITYEGGWRPIKAQRIITVLDATYDDLRLLGTIIQDEREVGKADLDIKFGAKMADGRRRKDIDLTASVTDIDLGFPMEELKLDGTGSGTITIKGPHTNFNGLAKAKIVDGRFLGLAFSHASTEIDITRDHLEFKDIRIAMPRAEVSEFSGVLEADLSPGRMHLHGEPLQGLAIDTTYAYEPKRWSISKISWTDPKRPSESLGISGSLVSGGALDISAKGAFDASLISAATAYVRENRGPMEVDLSLKGTTNDPRVYGSIGFDKTSLILRDPRIEVDSLSGAIRFDGDRISFDDITAEIEEGTAELSGSLNHRGMRPTRTDLHLKAKSMRYRSGDGAFNLELDGNLDLVGAYPQPLLSGDVTIVDGRYSKDFTIIDVLTPKEKKKERVQLEGEEEEFNPNLALRVRSSGDMEIKNNVGEIFLNVNVEVGGTRLKPIVTGSINTSEGYVDYLGLDFDITKGFLEFRGAGEEPYLEIHAEKEVRVYNVTMILYGPIDNLKMELEATSPYGPLDRHDVVSLLLFGATEKEREEARRSGAQIGAAWGASGVGGVLGGPIEQFAHIDSFKLEAAEPDSEAISRVAIGKEISDRLTVTFASDLGVDNAVQTFAAEYMITDNVLVEGQRSTDAKYEMSGILRFRLR